MNKENRGKKKKKRIPPIGTEANGKEKRSNTPERKESFSSNKYMQRKQRVSQEAAPPHSHAAVLVPQGLSVLWARRRPRSRHVIGVNALAVLFARGGAVPGLAGGGLALLAGLTGDGGSTDVAD